MKKFPSLVAIAALLACGCAQAAIVNIDLSSAVSGTLVNGVGADFAQTFSGQAVSGTAVTGSPTNPLSLQAAGTIEVAAFAPGVSAASNSLLSQPGNAAPLSILLDSMANAFNWTMGSATAGSTILASLFADDGSLVGSQTITMQDGYALYGFSGLGSFRGITFSNNNDGSGVRFQNMSYDTVTQAVPEPATGGLVGLALLAVAAAGARRRAAKAS